MTDLIRPLVDRVEDALNAAGNLSIQWGTVTSSGGALRIRLDGDVEELPFAPATAVLDLVEGERVICAVQRGRVIILNVAR